jgi:heterodisulfide reductase subunit B
LKVAYYPGCSLEATAKEYDDSFRAVCQILGVELEEVPDWSCCGASSAHTTNHLLSLALPARNMALVEGKGLDLVAPCPGCFINLKHAYLELGDDGELRKKLEEIIGMPYTGSVKLRTVFDVCREVGIENIQAKVKRSLNGLKLANYHGCFARFPGVADVDDPENPQHMDELMGALGAESVDWSHKTECCGGNMVLARTDIVIKLVDDICQSARRSGAEAIVSVCPLCQANLDTRQMGKDKLPIFYFSELMGLALGVEDKRVRSWWKRHIVSPLDALKSHNLT